MPLIWCAISSHGYGHAAQVVPVLNELCRRVSGIQLHLRTTVNEQFFKRRLRVHWTHSPVQQDIGCVQHGPLAIDVPATWESHDAFHADWRARVEAEAAAMRQPAPALVLSDIPPLALAAGARAGIPTVGLGSLSWDQVLTPHLDPNPERRTRQSVIVDQIRRAYAETALMIRLAPGLPMPAFPHLKDVSPVAQRLTPKPTELRKAIGAHPRDHVVIVAFGGISIDALPIARLEAMRGYRFVISGRVPAGCHRCFAADALPFSFGVLLGSGDVILTKPGYSTVVEAVEHNRPLVYVRRNNFADEQGLVDYLRRYGRGMELSMADFQEGRWEAALSAALQSPRPAERPPAPRGAAEAADLLAGLL
jgi:hypothetical protein